MLLLLSVFCYGPITPRHMCWWIGQAYTKDDKMIEDDLFHNLSQVGAETTPHPCRRFEDCSSTLVNFCVTSHVISPGTLFPIENDASPPPSPLPSPRDANLTHDAAPAASRARLTQALPAGPRLVFPEGGHFSNKWHAEPIAAALLDFISLTHMQNQAAGDARHDRAARR